MEGAEALRKPSRNTVFYQNLKNKWCWVQTEYIHKHEKNKTKQKNPIQKNFKPLKVWTTLCDTWRTENGKSNHTEKKGNKHYLNQVVSGKTLRITSTSRIPNQMRWKVLFNSEFFSRNQWSRANTEK